MGSDSLLQLFTTLEASLSKLESTNTAWHLMMPFPDDLLCGDGPSNISLPPFDGGQIRLCLEREPVKDIDDTEMLTQLEAVIVAFRSWNEIRDQPTAQAYLLSMLGNKDRRKKKTAAPQQKKSRKVKQTNPSAPPLEPGPASTIS